MNVVVGLPGTVPGELPNSYRYNEVMHACHAMGRYRYPDPVPGPGTHMQSCHVDCHWSRTRTRTERFFRFPVQYSVMVDTTRWQFRSLIFRWILSCIKPLYWQWRPQLQLVRWPGWIGHRVEFNTTPARSQYLVIYRLNLCILIKILQ